MPEPQWGKLRVPATCQERTRVLLLLFTKDQTKITLGNTKLAGIRALIPLVHDQIKWLHWNIAQSCKWLSDLWDTDKNRKLNPWSRSGKASDISPGSSCPLFMFKDWTVKWAAKQHLGSKSRSQLVSLCSHTKKQKVEVFFQSLEIQMKPQVISPEVINAVVPQNHRIKFLP